MHRLGIAPVDRAARIDSRAEFGAPARLHWRRSMIASLAGALLSFSAWADPARSAASEIFTQGVNAFKAGNFTGALSLFEQARAAGMDRPQLSFNLGVTYYKLGRYKEAEAAFAECVHDAAWMGICSYNRGLAAQAGNDAKTAAEAFTDAAKTSNDEKIEALALTMLERAGRRPTVTRGQILLGVGYDSNVTLVTDSTALQTSEKSDSYIELYAGFSHQLADSPWRLESSLYRLDYFDLDEFDLTTLDVAALRRLGGDGWQYTLGGRFEYSWLEDQGFQGIVSFEAGAVAYRAEQRSIYLRYQLSRIEGVGGEFEFLTGSRHRFMFENGARLGDRTWRYGYTLDVEDRDDLETATAFFSQSPLRHQVHARALYALASGWQLTPGVELEYSRYDDPERRTNGLVKTRADRQVRVFLRASRRINPNWQYVGEYDYTSNDSNLSEFSYRRHLITLSIIRSL